MLHLASCHLSNHVKHFLHLYLILRLKVIPLTFNCLIRLLCIDSLIELVEYPIVRSLAHKCNTGWLNALSSFTNVFLSVLTSRSNLLFE